jgi:2-dehydro-3-deoxyphosphogluconate aldolase/(4S)-4-hydroxy-2-oxoglutarate aldolase
MSSLGSLASHRIIPVIVIDDAGQATDVAHALAAGGIHCAEVTFRTPQARAAISAMAAVPNFTVGAGTVLSTDDLYTAIDAGATFVVSPGFDLTLVEATLAKNLGVLPGIATATEAQQAVKAGLDAVKFFPADRLGGVGTIRALAAPFANLGFVPSGGVTAASALEYLSEASVPAVSGSWMASRKLIADGDFAEIQRLSAESVEAMGTL